MESTGQQPTTKDPIATLLEHGPGRNTVHAVQHPAGGWSIVLELDGYYSGGSSVYGWGAKDMADFWCREAQRLGIPVVRGKDVPNGVAKS